MSIDATLQQLLDDPKAFLTCNALIIYGSPSSASGVKRFVLQATDKSGWQSVAGGDARNVALYVLYEEGTFNAQGSGPVSTPFDAHYISMRERDPKSGSWGDSKDTHYTLPSSGKPRLMVTSKLNGCTFGIGSRSDGGGRLVSHLRPPLDSAMGVVAGRLALDTATRTGFAGHKLDVSVMSSAQQNGTVIGQRSGGHWTFYAQRFQVGRTMDGVISDVQVYH